MKAHVLCVDDGSRSIRHRKSLEDAGFVVLNACDETQAVDLLKAHRVDVVCVDSRFLHNGGTGIGANIKSTKPDVPIALIRDNGAIPARFEEQVDAVVDKSDFDTRARWLIEELHGVQFPFFLQWFDDWKHRASEPNNPDR